MDMGIHKGFLKCLIILPCLLLIGCSSTFQGWGRSLENGVAEGSKSDSLTYNLATGARQGLTSSESRAALDSLIRNLGDSASFELQVLRDSLLGYGTQYRIGALRESLIGEKTNEDLRAIKDSLLNEGLRNYIAAVLHELNDSTKVAAANLRDSLVGAGTNALIKGIIDTAMTDLQSRLANQIYPEMRGNISFVEANATWLIVVIGFVALVICLIVWRQKEKYLNMAKLLTVQISRLPDDSSRQALKNSISENAKTIGIEDTLRELLQRQGI